MIPSIENLFGIHEQALTLRASRAEILAGNLANADTPGFKARDVDFAALLQGMPGGPLGLSATHSGHLGGGAGAVEGLALAYRVPLQPSVDGNTVDTQVEQSAFAENAIAYQASLTFLTARIQGLRLALRGE
jgi:flagellar basal-body rod protein FlgB